MAKREMAKWEMAKWEWRNGKRPVLLATEQLERTNRGQFRFTEVKISTC
jgi:hypothetical protein